MGFRFQMRGLGILSKYLKKTVFLNYEQHTTSEGFFRYKKDVFLTVDYRNDEGK